MNNQALLTDLYQLTMLQAYSKEGLHEKAVFELFFRGSPAKRSFLVMAGLEQVIEYITELHFSEEQREWLASTGLFSENFLQELAHFSFTGDVDAMPEGRIFFGDEPILRITAPLQQAQLVESRIINLIHYSVLIASKAARCTLAAPEKRLLDFGFRRSHGAEAGLLAARSCYIAGFAGTATVEAGKKFNIPVVGTMAHSYIQAHESEEEAFIQFARSMPSNVVLLIDTYDTEKAAHKIVKIAPLLREEGISIRAVRLDSGDLIQLSKKVRDIFDKAGLSEILIFCSGNLDEYKIKEIIDANSPIDSFGVGTKLVTSNDIPSLEAVYKLQEYAGIPRCKYSPGKETWPGVRQVYRSYDTNGMMKEDIITLEGDSSCEGQPLLLPVLRNGKRIAAQESIEDMRHCFKAEVLGLPASAITSAFKYPVLFSPVLRQLAKKFAANGQAVKT